jgi:CheY-like chemotaxis protein
MGQEEFTLRGVRVLVVDDEADARDLLTLIFTHYGAEVQAVASAAEALAAMDRWLPDVLVSDIGMPDDDGYTLIRKVRALDTDHGGNVPALALTAFSRSEDRKQALSAGFHGHLSKPADPVDLVTTVANLSKDRPRQ